jgi:dolichol-phosphate mannosyltransferase
LSGIRWDAIFVDDDSPDGTAEMLCEIGKRRENVRCIRRAGRFGLASACIEGAASTEAPFIAVIDADLQHDERLLPKMLATIRTRRLDIVVASRFIAEGGTADWQRWRVWLSHFARRLARCVVRAELTDPMSGFFLIERTALTDALPCLSGRGFKILLDIFASSPRPLAFAELPYCFRRRAHGRSKLDSQVAWQYLALLLDKIVDRMICARFVLFIAVGGSGVLTQLVFLRLMLDAFGIAFPAAQTLATLAAIAGNYLLNNIVTYRDRRLRGPALLHGLLAFFAVCAAGAVANVAIASHLFADGWRWWLAGLGGAAIGAVWNFAMSSALVWRPKMAPSAAPPCTPTPAPISPASTRSVAVTAAD